MLGRLFLAIAGVAVAAFTLSVTIDDSGFSFAAESPGSRALLIVGGLAPVAVGVLRYSGRVARSRVGVQLFLVGLAWLVGAWDDPGVGSDLAFTIGLCAFAACPPLVAHLLLAYPSGRLRSRADRVLVAAGYVSAIGVVGVLASLFFDPASSGCADCPANLASVSNDPAAFVRTSTDGIRLVFGWSIAAVVWQLWRLHRSTAVGRRAVAPVVLPGLAYMAATVLTFGASLGDPYVREGDLARRLWEVQAVSLVALAAGAAWALIASRRRHRELTRLVVDLNQSNAAGGMQETIAELLHDPDLRIAYPLSQGGYVDASGRSLDAILTGGLATSRLIHAGREVAVLVHSRGVLDDPRLVDEIASAAHLGLDNERLRAETRRQLADIRASRTRIVAAGDEERRRLERDLHDGAQQRVVGLALALRLLRNRAEADSGNLLIAAEQHVRQALDELRHLARGLYPVILSEEGLAVALDALSESAPLRVLEAPPGRFPAEIETTAYQVVAAAAAAGPAVASISTRADFLTVEVSTSAEPAWLQEVVDRVDALGGATAVHTAGDAWRVVVQLPLEPSSPQR